jgi:hypothetical protein
MTAGQPWMLAAALLTVACAHPDPKFSRDVTPRLPAGAPFRFIFDQGTLTSDSVAQMKCRTPLWDLRGDSTRLELVRSYKNRVADYQVTPARFGVGPEELMRISCKSGSIIGIVPK